MSPPWVSSPSTRNAGHTAAVLPACVRNAPVGRTRPARTRPGESLHAPFSNRLTFAVLATGAGVFSMLQSLIAPALPTVQHALHTSRSTAT